MELGDPRANQPHPALTFPHARTDLPGGDHGPGQHLLQYRHTSAKSWQTAKGIYRVSVSTSYNSAVTGLALVWSW